MRRAYGRASSSEGTFNDIRDDYDENFGRVRTPIERARRKLIGPAIALLLIGVVGVIASLMRVAAITLEFYPASNDEDVWLGAFFIVLTLIGGAMCLPIARGGWSMLDAPDKSRRSPTLRVGRLSSLGKRSTRRVELRPKQTFVGNVHAETSPASLALVAAYAVTGLSLCPLYAVPLIPFGIWALVLLYDPDIRSRFDRPELAGGPGTPFAISPESASIRIPANAYLVAGGIGLPLMLAICCGILWDSFTSMYPLER